MRGETVAEGVALELNLLGVDGYRLPGPDIGRINRFSVNLFHRGAPGTCAALQNDISGHGILPQK